MIRLALFASLVAASFHGAASSRGNTVDVLEVALRFYHPPPGQARWLDGRTLDDAQCSLDPRELGELVARLGAGPFCTADTRRACRSARGGRLRVSPVSFLDDGRARVEVEFESGGPYLPAIATRQVFVLRHNERGWQVISREFSPGR